MQEAAASQPHCMRKWWETQAKDSLCIVISSSPEVNIADHTAEVVLSSDDIAEGIDLPRMEFVRRLEGLISNTKSTL